MYYFIFDIYIYNVFDINIIMMIKFYDLIDFHSAWSVLTRMMPPLSLAVVVRQSTRLQEL